MFVSMVSAFASSVALDTVFGSLLEFEKKLRTYEEQETYVRGNPGVRAGGKSLPMDPPALIANVISGLADPALTRQALAWHGLNAQLYDQAFFTHTQINNNVPGPILDFEVTWQGIAPNKVQKGIDASVWNGQGTLDITSILNLMNRRNINEVTATALLQRNGVRDPGLQKLVMSQRNEVPPLQDLIRMSVRDSFTPQSVAFYKEANEYPLELDRYVEWVGLGWPSGINYGPSTDDQGRPRAGGPATWGHIYWASHWIEPSPTQAYEMLFRGYRNSIHGPSPYIQGAGGRIDQDLEFAVSDLNKLLKSADYGPYWRKRLEMIAYHPLNITDIKRMYRVGELDEPGVYHGMRAQGYDDRTSQQLTKFVLRTERPQITSEVQRAFMSGIMGEQQARQALVNGGLAQREINFAILKWQLDLRNRLADQELRLIHRARLTGIASEPVTRAALNQLGIDFLRIDEYLRQWDREVTLTKRIPALRMIVKWYIDGIIDRNDVISRLQRLRYTDIDINRILREADLRRESNRVKAERTQQRERVASERQAQQSQDTARQRADKERKENERRAKERIKAEQERSAELEAASEEQQSARDRVVMEQQKELEDMLRSIAKGSTDKYLLAFYRKGLINEDQVRQRLDIRGLTKEDADKWVKTYLKGVPNG